jgi:uncharacterized protein (DUF58 family)
MADGTEEVQIDPFAPELMARVRQIQIRTHRMVSEVLSGAYRSTFRGSGIEFEEVRPYQPGDDVRSIDWQRTARGQDAFVKTYVEERELSLVFLVDTTRSMDFGSREFTKREVAAQFCALLAYVALRQQDRVGLCLFGKEPGLHLPPQKGSGSVARVVREVIAAQPTAGASDFKAALEHQARTLRRRALVFLVSDFLGDDLATPGERPAWTDTLASLARRHDVIAVRVNDPFESELPAAGWLTLADLETGQRTDVDTRSKRVRAAWAAKAQARRAALDAVLARSRTDLIALSTEGDVVDPVASFFRSRTRRRGGPA